MVWDFSLFNFFTVVADLKLDYHWQILSLVICWDTSHPSWICVLYLDSTSFLPGVKVVAGNDDPKIYFLQLWFSPWLPHGDGGSLLFLWISGNVVVSLFSLILYATSCHLSPSVCCCYSESLSSSPQICSRAEITVYFLLHMHISLIMAAFPV